MSLAQLDQWFRRVGCERADRVKVPVEHKGRRAYYLPVIGEVTAPDSPKPKALSSAEGGDLRLRVVMTTPVRDRDGDVVVPEGMGLKWFRKNPVVLWAHQYDLPPVGNVDVATLRVSNKGIEADVIFDKGGVLAREVHGLYQRGVMHAWSIGFTPVKWDVMEDRKTGKVSGYRVTQWELLELSAVPVPANPDALTRTVRQYESRGYDPNLLPVVNALKAAAQPPPIRPSTPSTGSGTASGSGPSAIHNPPPASAASERTADVERKWFQRERRVQALAQAVLTRLSTEVDRLIAREVNRRRGVV